MRLEYGSNNHGKYTLGSVKDLGLEAKEFYLLFPEGKEATEGGTLLGEKLRLMGVSIIEKGIQLNAS